MKYKISEEQLKIAIKENYSWSKVCDFLNIKNRGGNQSHLKNRAKKLNLDFSHFTGRGWRKGKIFEKIEIKEYLENKRYINSHSLKLRLFREGFKEKKCEKCGLQKWLNEEIVLELDHINSNHKDNSLENLQIVCPNCHALETRNRVKKEKIVIKNNDKRKERKNRINLRKVIRPSLENLLKDIEDIGYSATGRKYKVSDNCIRKWIKWETAGKVDNSDLESEAKKK